MGARSFPAARKVTYLRRLGSQVTLMMATRPYSNYQSAGRRAARFSKNSRMWHAWSGNRKPDRCCRQSPLLPSQRWLTWRKRDDANSIKCGELSRKCGGGSGV